MYASRHTPDEVPRKRLADLFPPEPLDTPAATPLAATTPLPEPRTDDPFPLADATAAHEDRRPGHLDDRRDPAGSDAPTDSEVDGGPEGPSPAAERFGGRSGGRFRLDPGRRGVRALVVIAVVVAAVAAFVAWRSRPRAEPVHAPAVPAAATGATQPVGTIVVSVIGKVRHPGLVHLPSGARVADAIEAAGGVVPGTDLGYLNVARRLYDGELVVIDAPPSGAPAAPGGPPGAAPAPGTTKINLNTATAEQLDALPGVGPVLAAQIVTYRDHHGPFGAVADLRHVSGVGPAKYDQIKDLVTV